MSWDNGWLWLIAALVLALLELLAPAWIFLGVAIAVALMGLVLLMGLWSGGLPMALVVTAILSGVIWYLLRRMAGVRKDQVRVWKRDINDND
jgi:membrane protein implicated in regulation of membrane protease activity